MSVAELLAILVHFLAVAGFKSRLVTGYPDSGVPQSLQANSEIVPQIRPLAGPLSSKSCQIHYSFIILPADAV
jgi:hypothetical protein